MNETMRNALLKLFERYRIVFWYCDDPMLAMDYDALQLDGVEKRDITGRALAEIMDGNYVNNCLVRMNTAFQKTLDGLNRRPFETSLPL